MTTTIDQHKELSLRFDVSKEDSIPLIERLNKYLKCVNYLWVYEISKKEKKEHIHGYAQVPLNFKEDNMRKWIGRQKWYKGRGTYSIAPVNDKNKYLNYISKDMNILLTTFDEAQIDHLMETAQTIADDKNRSMIDKLFNYVVGDYIADYEEGLKTPLDDFLVLEKLITYYREKRLLMPNKSQMFQYVQTILNITGNITSVFADYYSLFTVKETPKPVIKSKYTLNI